MLCDDGVCLDLGDEFPQHMHTHTPHPTPPIDLLHTEPCGPLSSINERRRRGGKAKTKGKAGGSLASCSGRSATG
jgi:hypothetical protein